MIETLRKLTKAAELTGITIRVITGNKYNLEVKTDNHYYRFIQADKTDFIGLFMDESYNLVKRKMSDAIRFSDADIINVDDNDYTVLYRESTLHLIDTGREYTAKEIDDVLNHMYNDFPISIEEALCRLKIEHNRYVDTDGEVYVFNVGKHKVTIKSDLNERVTLGKFKKVINNFENILYTGD